MTRAAMTKMAVISAPEGQTIDDMWRAKGALVARHAFATTAAE